MTPAEAVRRGLVVAAATESSFGLLADAGNPQALDLLLSLKPRGAAKSQALIVPDLAAFEALVSEVPPLARRLADAFWPGPLTLVLGADPTLDPRVVLDGGVAARVPGPSPASEIVREVQRPLTATSANLPGEPPALDDERVRETFAEAVRAKRLLVVPGRAPGGAPSSMVQIRGGEAARQSWKILRFGAIPEAELKRVLRADAD